MASGDLRSIKLIVPLLQAAQSERGKQDYAPVDLSDAKRRLAEMIGLKNFNSKDKS